MSPETEGRTRVWVYVCVCVVGLNNVHRHSETHGGVHCSKHCHQNAELPKAAARPIGVRADATDPLAAPELDVVLIR